MISGSTGWMESLTRTLRVVYSVPVMRASQDDSTPPDGHVL